ncbi:MAG: hypothetical protein DI539_22680 [Flavobacterium psychrophilum]|nr:MAG: hypothetical protein DI539_22680 [Flavobacterium psychrophilum]
MLTKKVVLSGAATLAAVVTVFAAVDKRAPTGLYIATAGNTCTSVATLGISANILTVNNTSFGTQQARITTASGGGSALVWGSNNCATGSNEVYFHL